VLGHQPPPADAADAAVAVAVARPSHPSGCCCCCCGCREHVPAVQEGRRRCCGTVDHRTAAVADGAATHGAAARASWQAAVVHPSWQAAAAHPSCGCPSSSGVAHRHRSGAVAHVALAEAVRAMLPPPLHPDPDPDPDHAPDHATHRVGGLAADRRTGQACRVESVGAWVVGTAGAVAVAAGAAETVVGRHVGVAEVVPAVAAAEAGAAGAAGAAGTMGTAHGQTRLIRLPRHRCLHPPPRLRSTAWVAAGPAEHQTSGRHRHHPPTPPPPHRHHHPQAAGVAVAHQTRRTRRLHHHRLHRQPRCWQQRRSLLQPHLARSAVAKRPHHSWATASEATQDRPVPQRPTWTAPCHRDPQCRPSPRPRPTRPCQTTKN